jgi:CRISPR/Cas system-associated protein Cas10 (large subunit of type III CRISPR-Cas system)
MSEYLFVAEADKIQDLLFRSSKLREVAGGSEMLNEFCKDVVPLLIKRCGVSKDNEVISSGGSFRIRFDKKEKAEEFGEYLSELYRRELGGTITVAEPVEVTTEPEAIKNAQKYLRKAKHCGKAPVSVLQIPYIALCASCGTGIAIDYKEQFKDEKPNYLCEVCKNKAKARNEGKMSFLARFLSHLSTVNSEAFEFPNEANEIAKLEPRKYVAYLIADGNSMGTIFSACNNFDKLKLLSNGLDEMIQDSLAEPTKILIEKEKQKKHMSKKSKTDLVPVLPLILGGDDVFALIPAQWALDFTQRFAHEFEERMARHFEEIDIQSSIIPTISAAVIICKAKFPYSIAYELGEELLKKAKKRAKKEGVSTISFALIKGNELVKSAEENKTFIAGFPAYTIEELTKLIEYRWRLRNLPGTRRAQLERLFLRAEKLDFAGVQSEWTAEKLYILNRLEKKLRSTTSAAFEELGDKEEKHNWLDKDLSGVYYHKLPDLLNVWDYAYDLKKDDTEYETEAEEE